MLSAPFPSSRTRRSVHAASRPPIRALRSAPSALSPPPHHSPPFAAPLHACAICIVVCCLAAHHPAPSGPLPVAPGARLRAHRSTARRPLLYCAMVTPVCPLYQNIKCVYTGTDMISAPRPPAIPPTHQMCMICFMNNGSSSYDVDGTSNCGPRVLADLDLRGCKIRIASLVFANCGRQTIESSLYRLSRVQICL